MTAFHRSSLAAILVWLSLTTAYAQSLKELRDTANEGAEVNTSACSGQICDSLLSLIGQMDTMQDFSGAGPTYIELYYPKTINCIGQQPLVSMHRLGDLTDRAVIVLDGMRKGACEQVAAFAKRNWLFPTSKVIAFSINGTPVQSGTSISCTSSVFKGKNTIAFVIRK